MLGEFKTWYVQYPLFTRTYITLASLIALIGKVQPVVFYQIFLDWDKVWRFQIHRLVTHFFFQGTLNFHFIFNLLMIYFALGNCERLFEGPSYADFYFMILYFMFTGNIFAWLFEYPTLGSALIFAMIYVWCKRKPFETVRFYFGFQFKSEYFPWILIGFHFIVGDDITQDLVGLAIAHSYLLFVDFLPVTYNRRFLATPKFLTNFVNRFITPFAPFGKQQQNPQAQRQQQQRFFGGQGVRLG